MARSIRRSSTQAAPAPVAPTTTAMAISISSRRSALKSPSTWSCAIRDAIWDAVMGRPAPPVTTSFAIASATVGKEGADPCRPRS
ncbi:hypothetical protein AZA_78649 [Nitrospirillum viridazoti Y2]|nr:hypothetical protein AZA_78649 [Nitrospirillum amazonense Y2]